MQPLEPVAKAAAIKYGLKPELVCALIEQESGWDTWAIRYEPEFREEYVVPLQLSPTEEVARSFSWGLGQVMGQTARELGLTSAMPSLCDPAIGVDYLCRKLNRCMANAEGNVEKALLLYNGGGNSNYSTQVLAKMPHYTEVA